MPGQRPMISHRVKPLGIGGRNAMDGEKGRLGGPIPGERRGAPFSGSGRMQKRSLKKSLKIVIV